MMFHFVFCEKGFVFSLCRVCARGFLASLCVFGSVAVDSCGLIVIRFFARELDLLFVSLVFVVPCAGEQEFTVLKMRLTNFVNML